MLYGKGLFKFEDAVSKHWPEFAQNGKTDVRICDVFRHQSGLAWFTEAIPSYKDAYTENIKKNKLGEFIEKQKLHFPERTKTEYHSQSRGMIINEVVRRLDSRVSFLSKYLIEKFREIKQVHTTISRLVQ